MKKIFACLAAVLFLFAASAQAKCIYCGYSGYGTCSKSPYKVHEHEGDEDTCVFCGYKGYGSCSKSPFKVHKHGHGSKCVWCGYKGYGSCSKAPGGKHEH
jgi:hypothetical protein